MEVVLAEITPAIKNTGNWRGPIAFRRSERPEKAMELYNLMYTDPEVAKPVLLNGIEGKHYEYTDDSKTIIRLPDGAAEGNTGYTSVDLVVLNCMITLLFWEGGDPDLWKKMDEFNKSATASPALGFKFDSTSVMNEGDCTPECAAEIWHPFKLGNSESG